MDDQEYIEAIRKARREAVSFFSASRKSERERWVVNEFLENLGFKLGVDALTSPDSDPPDVIYKDARFEVKEILDQGRRRHAEYKDSLRQAERARSAADLLEGYAPQDVRYSEIGQMVIERLATETKYAPSTRRQLDILFYVNLEDVHGCVSDTLPSSSEIEAFGWRSVSFLAGPMGVVLHTCGNAPEFLQSLTGRVVRKVSAS